MSSSGTIRALPRLTDEQIQQLLSLSPENHDLRRLVSEHRFYRAELSQILKSREADLRRFNFELAKVTRLHDRLNRLIEKLERDAGE